MLFSAPLSSVSIEKSHATIWWYKKETLSYYQASGFTLFTPLLIALLMRVTSLWKPPPESSSLQEGARRRFGQTLIAPKLPRFDCDAALHGMS